MDDKIKTVLDRVIRLCDQNTEFESELRKALSKEPFADIASIGDEKIDQIYEYCIEKVIRRQATEFYTDFPLESIVPILIEDFVRMESFRRKDQFGDFCLSLYQQIECITNKLCESKILGNITEKMWGCPAYVKSGKDIEPRVDNRVDGSSYTIASLLFTGQDKKTGMLNSLVKSRQALQNLHAIDKIKTVVYFVGYKAAMKNSDYDNYVEITSSIYDAYQCRNMNHRGNTLTPREKDTQGRILPMKSYYYFKFMGVLAQYANSIKIGFHSLPEVEKFANSIAPSKVKAEGVNIKGKIELPIDNKKRIR